MKKSICIIALVAMLGACASQSPDPVAANSLISFAEISAEITVRHEPLEEASVAEETTTLGFTGTP